MTKYVVSEREYKNGETFCEELPAYYTPLTAIRNKKTKLNVLNPEYTFVYCVDDELRVTEKISIEKIVANSMKKIGIPEDIERKINPGNKFVRILSAENDDIVFVPYRRHEVISTGENCQIIAYHHEVKIFSCGENAQIILTKDGSNEIVSTGSFAEIYSSSPCNHINASGFRPRIFNSGNGARIVVDGGDGSQIVNTGNFSNISVLGGFSACESDSLFDDSTLIKDNGNGTSIVACGNNIKVETTGENVFVELTGHNIYFSGKKGTYVFLTYFVSEGKAEKVVKYIDGEKIKENTMYNFKNGNLTEC